MAWGCGDGDASSRLMGLDGDGSDPAAAFADTALEATVRSALEKPDGELTEDDLLSLTQLEAQGRGISDLRGIGRLCSLTVLDLSNNRIVDISPVSGLTKLVLLDVTGNQIEDISPLTALVNLETVVLEDNHIRDIAPLLQLEHLNSLELTGNPLNVASVDQTMPLLQSRGVEIALQPSSGSAGPSYRDFDIAYVGKRSPNSRRTDIFLRNTDGSPAINLTDDTSLYSDLTWSPDGSKIAFVFTEDFDYPSRICVLDVSSGDMVQLTETRGSYLTWSPDGSKIAFHWRFSSQLRDLRYSEVFVMGSDGSNPTDLTKVAQNRTYHTPPAWSPDGTRIAFTRYTTVGYQIVEGAVLVASADGSNILNLYISGRTAQSPVWSPEGEEVAFLSGSDANPDAHDLDIYVVDADGGVSVNLTNDPAVSYFGGLAWSPGSKIAAIALPTNPYGIPQLIVLDRDTGVVHTLTDFTAHGNLTDPRWSPDGTRISVIYGFDIWIVDPNGGALFNLTNNVPPLRTFDCAWRPR